jgi:hypothetical protein
MNRAHLHFILNPVQDDSNAAAALAVVAVVAVASARFPKGSLHSILNATCASSDKLQSGKPVPKKTRKRAAECQLEHCTSSVVSKGVCVRHGVRSCCCRLSSCSSASYVLNTDFFHFSPSFRVAHGVIFRIVQKEQSAMGVVFITVAPNCVVWTTVQVKPSVLAFVGPTEVDSAVSLPIV